MNRYIILLDCVVGLVVVVVVVITDVVGLLHLSSSDPSAHCFMPSHLLSLLTQAPYLHWYVYF